MADEFETVIGLECHVELSTATKMFCGCRNAFGAPANTNVCPVCLGLPGSLPVPNQKAIESIVKIGLAFGSEIAPHSLFHRKNYFYPDMPKDYQISQYDLPICVGGHLDVDVDGGSRRIGITRVHMEEDTGKTTHGSASGRIHEADYALVDYNRAGVPLVEIVSEPDMRSAQEAGAYLRTLRSTVEALGVSDVRMEEGSLRCDANVSVRPRGSSEFGVKVEIKNMNSVRSLERAIRYEEERQREAVRAGEALVQETRHWNEDTGVTTSMRSKEEAFDYRYFPEPDLPLLAPEPEWVERLRSELPELPAASVQRLTQAGVRPDQAQILATTAGAVAYFDGTVASGASAVNAALWMTQDLAALMNREKVGFDEIGSLLPPGRFASIVMFVDSSEVSPTGAKAALEEVFVTGKDPERVVEELGLRQVSDAGALAAMVEAVIAENPGPVEQFRGGKEGIVGFLVGQVMKRSGGSANPKVVSDLLRERLAGT